VVRAAIENNLIAQEGARSKLYYIGPVFRYERPQKGRLRQHHQFGVETFGIEGPEADAECIMLQMEFYRRCGVKDLALKINSLGDAESKQRYREMLLAFLQPKKDQLSEDSQRRIAINPLRILDSKDLADRECCRGAPPAAEALSEKSRRHFERVQELLSGYDVPFQVDPNLVRGFDYYTETLWEVTAEGLGAQNAVGGGGRYDRLVEQLGGRRTPGVGFGIGLERLLIVLDAQGVAVSRPHRPLVWLVAHGDAARQECWSLMWTLRQTGIMADMDASGRSVKAQFKLADREQAAWCIVIGDAELAGSTVVLKDLASGEQATIARSDLIEHLKTRARLHISG
jgi:histidyl-tRNA synthetase